MSNLDQAPNRALILDDIRAYLSTIRLDTGWPIEVVTIGDKLRQADEMQLEELPWVGVYAAPASPPAEYFPFGRKRVTFDVLVVAHVRGADQAEKEEQVALLESAIETVLQIDPTRDGFAIDTWAVGATDSDEAQPDKGGRIDKVTDLQIRYRTNFVPSDEEGRHRVAHGEIIKSGANQNTVLAAGVPAALAIDTELAEDASTAVLFDQPGDGILRYTGARPRTMRLEAFGAISALTADAVSLIFVRTRGAVLVAPEAQVSLNLEAGNVDQVFSIAALIDLEQNDTIHVRGGAAAGCTVTVSSFAMSAVPVSRF